MNKIIIHPSPDLRDKKQRFHVIKLRGKTKVEAKKFEDCLNDEMLKMNIELDK